MRPGTQTLLLLTKRPRVAILRALRTGPTRATELGHAPDTPGEGALRTQLRRLVAVGAIDKRRLNRFPGVLEYELTDGGRGLLELDEVLDRWLAEAPHRPPRPGTDAATAAVKALADGWSAGVVAGIATGLLTLGELAREIGSASYPLLEHRLAALRQAGLVQPCAASRRDTRNTPDYWLRRAVTPLLAAARWEQLHDPAAARLSRADREALSLLAAPPLLPAR